MSKESVVTDTVYYYRQYRVCMYAIGSEYGNSAVSNSLLINTPGSRFCAGQMLDSSMVDFESWEANDQTDLKVQHVITVYSPSEKTLSVSCYNSLLLYIIVLVLYL